MQANSTNRLTQVDDAIEALTNGQFTSTNVIGVQTADGEGSRFGGVFSFSKPLIDIGAGHSQSRGALLPYNLIPDDVLDGLLPM